MIQVDGPRRCGYIKFITAERLMLHIPNIHDQKEYKYESGEISKVQVCEVGIGVRNIRVQCLPPEVHDKILHDAMSKYGDVGGITTEIRPKSTDTQ
jgi:hypothetical protein